MLDRVNVQNDPVNYTDPWGLLKRDSSGKLVFHSVGFPVSASHPSGANAVLQGGKLYADDGTAISAYKYVSGHQGMETDCHGTTFGDSEYWINNDQVDKILSGDSYSSTTTPAVGDVLIYRDTGGDPVHSLTVTSVDSNGTVTGVTGLGGIQTTTSTTTPAQGWSGPATLHYYTK